MTTASLSRAQLKSMGEELYQKLVSIQGADAVHALVEPGGELYTPDWPDTYTNRDTSRGYKPHHEAEAAIVYSDTPTHLLLKGGEGSGKSAASIIKTLNRIKRGMSGIMASNSLPHFCTSLWPEFQRWCPWEMVHPKDQKKADRTWEPYRSVFNIVFNNGAVLQCGGIEDPEVWRGPNVSFAFIDEASRQKDATILKVISGRTRIPGPNGEPPQIWFATTPAGRNWLWRYFGALQCHCPTCDEDIEVYIQHGEEFKCLECGSTDLEVLDPLEDFKRDSRVATLSTLDNELAGNVQSGYTNTRGLTLTEMEKRVFLQAEWDDITAGQPFLPSPIWWDQCKGDVPELDHKTPLVIGVDAATGREVEDSDCFAIVAVSPDPASKKDSVIVRYARAWQAKAGGEINFRGSESNPGPERELLRLCGYKLGPNGGIVRNGGGYNVKCIACDPLGLDDMIQRFRQKRVSYMKEIGQNVQRVKADTNLLRMIQERRITHDGDRLLRDHLRNADRKVDDFGHKLRIVKREKKLRIDLSIALSQAAHVCTKLNL